MPRDIDSLTGELLRLTPKDRRAILARVEAFTPGGADEGSDLLYEALKDYGTRAGVPMPSLPELRRQKVISTRFKKAVPIVLKLIKDELKLTKELDVRRAHELIIDMIARRLKEQRTPVTCWSLCMRLPDAAAYLYRAFPGYKESGLLPFVAQRMVSQWRD